MNRSVVAGSLVAIGFLVSGNPIEAQLERGKTAGPVMVKDANGVVLGRVASTSLAPDGAPTQIVIVTTKGYTVTIGADGTRNSFYDLGFTQASCAGDAYAYAINSTPASSVPGWIGYNPNADRYFVATGAALATTSVPALNSKHDNRPGTACLTRLVGLVQGTRTTPVRLMTADEAGLPATIKGPLTLF